MQTVHFKTIRLTQDLNIQRGVHTKKRKINIYLGENTSIFFLKTGSDTAFLIFESRLFHSRGPSILILLFLTPVLAKGIL